MNSEFDRIVETDEITNDSEEIRTRRMGGVAVEAAESEDAEQMPSNTEETREDCIRDIENKSRENDNFRRTIKAALATVIMAAGILAAKTYINSNKNEFNPTHEPTRPQGEFSEFELGLYEGELSNGVKYDYRDYVKANAVENSKRLELHSHHYGEDLSWLSDMPENTPEEKATKQQAISDEFMRKAQEEPEALGSFVESNVLDDNTKRKIGILGMTGRQIEEYMSDENNVYGGMLQSDLLAHLQEAISQPNTEWKIHLQYGYEDTEYIDFEDKNNDGKITPDETSLCKQTNVERKGVPQAALYIDGKLVLDLNLQCGMQPTFEVGESPADIPVISQQSETPTPTITPAPSPTPTPEQPSPTPAPTPSPTQAGGNGEDLQPKNTTAETANTGPRISEKELNETETPPTTIKQDQANFDDLENQRRERQEKEAEAIRAKAEQAEKERLAAEEAEKRRQAEAAAEAEKTAAKKAEEAESKRLADEAAARAEAEAAERQREAAEAERKRQAEEAARQAAQEEADRLAREQEANARAMSTNDEARDAEDFNNGAFALNQ